MSWRRSAGRELRIMPIFPCSMMAYAFAPSPVSISSSWTSRSRHTSPSIKLAFAGTVQPSRHLYIVRVNISTCVMCDPVAVAVPISVAIAVAVPMAPPVSMALIPLDEIPRIQLSRQAGESATPSGAAGFSGRTGLSRVASAEDHALHAVPAQTLRALLP